MSEESPARAGSGFNVPGPAHPHRARVEMPVLNQQFEL